MPICKKHNIKKIQKFNSTILFCPECEKEKSKAKIEHNKKLLTESTLFGDNKKKSFKTGRYAGKVKSGLKRTKTPRQKAMNLADKWFSIYIRIKYAYKIQDGEVYDQCIVNPNVIKHAKFFDNGHCLSRNAKATRYEEDNCRPQNRSSNRYKGEADHPKFVENLIKQIGKERYEKIERLSKTEIEDNEIFYKLQAEKYKKLVNELVAKNNINKWW